ncbi:hypothetical protein ABW19_dt0207098 [Dactylella cylindrospora]|nr:hypothetical protein ABW19_dt0207098 [Dactylella cylindrospora]
MSTHATLTTLPPELLSSILSHLNLKDIYSLILTCKSLYPISHRKLWSVLHLCDRIPQKYRGPPCPPFVHNPDNAIGNDGCRRLVRAIKELGAENLGFGSVRGLVLEPECFSRSVVRDGLVRAIGDEIENGRMMGVRWVKVSVWSNYLETSDNPPEGIERFLRILKEYSEGKSSDEFSFILDANFITSISPWYRPKSTLFDLIDLEKITSLDLQLDIFCDEDEDDPIGFDDEDDLEVDEISAHGSNLDEEDSDGVDAEGEGIKYSKSAELPPAYATLGEQISDLTKLLNATVNLNILKLATDTEDRGYMPPPIYRLGTLLNNLQAAFTSLRKLRWLFLRGPLFHPSFFVTPPENVRFLKISCDVSVSWWRRFAKCQFRNVEDLRIVHHFAIRGSWMGPEDEDDYKAVDDGDMSRLWGDPFPFELGDVAVEGLKRFWMEGVMGPEDLVSLVLKKNKGLDEECVSKLEGVLKSGGTPKIRHITDEYF